MRSLSSYLTATGTSASSGCQSLFAAAAHPVSLRMIADGFADVKRGGHALIAQMERHPGGGMVQVVTVVHPDSGVVGPKRHFIALPGGDVESVRPPGTAGDRLSVFAQDQHVVS